MIIITYIANFNILQNTVAKFTADIENYQNIIIKSYVDSKEKFENDVKILEEASILLEEREQTYINKINELKEDVLIKENNNVTLSNTINSLKYNLEKLVNDNDHYQNILKNEMVPKTNYDILTNNMTKLNNDITNYQKLVENEMVPKGIITIIIIIINLYL